VNEKEREQLIGEWNFPEAPKVSDSFPGPKAAEVFGELSKLETPQIALGSVLPFVPEEAKGAVFKDVDGNFVIDFCSCISVVSVGHQHPKVVEAIADQAGKLGHVFDIATREKLDLIKRMSATAPPGLRDDCFVTLALSGTDAACAAAKNARMATGKNQVIAFTGGYHGVFGTALAMTTGNRYREDYGPLMGGVVHLPYAYCYRCPFGMEYPKCGIECAKYADSMLNQPYTGITDAAALIVEPVQGEGGFIVPPSEWFQQLKQSCEKHGCLMVSDEVQSGFGKTGKLWATEHFGFEPDALIFGKAVGGDQPLTGVMMRSEHREKLVLGSQPATFSGNVISLAASMANYEIMTDPDLDLMGRATRLGEEMQSIFVDAQKSVEQIGDIRGLGLMQAIEFVKDPETKEPADAGAIIGIMIEMFQKGVIVVPAGRWGNTLRFMPPLTIKRDQFFDVVEMVVDTIKAHKDALAG
jgi:4-aminobutyrate aminotransferase